MHDGVKILLSYIIYQYALLYVIFNNVSYKSVLETLNCQKILTVYETAVH